MKYRLLICASFLCLSIGAIIAQQSSNSTTNINNGWTFIKGSEKTEEVVNLPHTWNVLDSFDEEPGFFRGKGIYSKTIELNQVIGKRFFLYFEGAATVAKVYCNDQFCGDHIGAYGSFAIDISDAAKNGGNVIRVEVDNSYHEEIAPLSADFTFMGGINRNVNLIETGAVHFERLDHGSNGVTFIMPEVSEKLAEVKITSKISNTLSKRKNLIVTHRLIDAQGNVVKTIDDRLKASEKKYQIEQNITVENPALWSPETPYLYKLVSEIINPKTDVVYDRVINNVGFRWYEYTAEVGLKLNGKNIKLKGINKFSDYAGLGTAVPDEYHWHDLKLIKEAGFNSIRLGHFQRSPVVLDACDKLGFIVTCEVPLIDEITLTEEFSSNMINMLYDLVRRDINHPSIWGWGLSNEILLRMPKHLSKDEKNDYRTYLRNLLLQMDSIVKKEDPYRPTMSVMHLFYALYKRAKIHNIGDIAAINLYPGWYSGTPDQMEGIARTTYEKNTAKPFLITEYGAGADPRLRSDDPHPFDFSLEYQVDVHKQWYKTIRDNDFITGSYVWLLSDFGSEKRGDSEPKINSKGLVSFDRIPKDAYYYYQAALSEKPIVAIASKNWSYGSGIEDAELNEVCSRKFEVFSNLNEVELFINGETLGKCKVENNTATWKAPFRNGKNSICAIGLTKEGKQIADSHEVDFNIVPGNLTAANGKNIEIRVNAGSNCYFWDKDEKAVWLPNQEYFENGFGFVGGQNLITKLGRPGRIGTNYNILGTNKDPLFQTQHVSPQAFKADVPAGIYAISIGLSDLFKKATEKLAYELAGEDSEKASLEDVENRFNIIINGKLVFENINPREMAGETSALELSTQIYTNGGIEILFEQQQGISFVNTIKIIKQ
ncbi:glycoside hydrolase family 2 protein [Labilibacter sediminis]|nr:glycoside hydrolase family 2 protein [Labilibacter sediminis]